MNVAFLRSQAFVLLPLLFFPACSRQGLDAPKGGSEIRPSQMKLKRKIELTQVARQPFQASLETVGHLEPEGQTDIAAGVSGVVDDVLFREGQWVDRDTLLVKVDQKRYKAGLDSALSVEKKAEAALVLTKDLEGLTRLAGAGSSGEDRVRASGNTKLADAELSQARASRELAQHNYNRSQVRAPYAGQINQRKITVGTYLEDKTVIATIANLSKIRLVGFIPEKSTPELRAALDREEGIRAAWLLSNSLGNPLQTVVAGFVDGEGVLPFGYEMKFTLRAIPNEVFVAKLFYISSVASPDTHMFECKGLIRPGQNHAKLRPGFTAKIVCPLPGKSDAIVVPEEAVRASEKGFIVFVPSQRKTADGTMEWVAKPKTLQLGLRKPGFVEVLEGLSPGEWVVRRGADALEEGTPLDISREMESGLVKEMKNIPSPKENVRK